MSDHPPRSIKWLASSMLYGMYMFCVAGFHIEITYTHWGNSQYCIFQDNGIWGMMGRRIILTVFAVCFTPGMHSHLVSTTRFELVLRFLTLLFHCYRVAGHCIECFAHATSTARATAWSHFDFKICSLDLYLVKFDVLCVLDFACNCLKTLKNHLFAMLEHRSAVMPPKKRS